MTRTPRRKVVAALAALPLAVAMAPSALARSQGGTVYIAGDSTAAQKYADAAPETGWGMALPFFLRDGPDGRQPRDERPQFEELHRRGPARRHPRGDRAGRPPSRPVRPQRREDRGPHALHRAVDDVSGLSAPVRRRRPGARRAAGARHARRAPPVRRTPATPCPRHGDYPPAMRALAEEEGVALLDIQALSLALWQKLGRRGDQAVLQLDAPPSRTTPTSIRRARSPWPGSSAAQLLERQVLAQRRRAAPRRGDSRRPGSPGPRRRARPRETAPAPLRTAAPRRRPSWT